MKAIQTLFAAAFLMSAAMGAGAVDGISFSKGATITRAGVQWDFKKEWRPWAGWRVVGYWDVEVGVWKDGNELVDLSATPVFRLMPAEGRMYLEGAIGFHMLSGTEIGGRRLGSNFQFGDHVGAGYLFGDRGRYDVGLRLQHHSNGGIKKPNSGHNDALLRLEYRYPF